MIFQTRSNFIQNFQQ
ncbi:MAG: hypothetical protein ACLSF3_11425 [Anaerobutyricum hallii]